MNYIRFAIEEPHLFRFLFQSDYFSGKTLLELIDDEELINSQLEQAYRGAILAARENMT